MADLTFCNVENRPFPSADFFTSDAGITIHVLSDEHGHTLDGWKATFTGCKGSGRWTLKHPKFERPQVQQLDMQNLPEGPE